MCVANHPYKSFDSPPPCQISRKVRLDVDKNVQQTIWASVCTPPPTPPHPRKLFYKGASLFRTKAHKVFNIKYWFFKICIKFILVQLYSRTPLSDRECWRQKKQHNIRWDLWMLLWKEIIFMLAFPNWRGGEETPKLFVNRVAEVARWAFTEKFGLGRIL